MKYSNKLIRSLKDPKILYFVTNWFFGYNALRFTYNDKNKVLTFTGHRSFDLFEDFSTYEFYNNVQIIKTITSYKTLPKDVNLFDELYYLRVVTVDNKNKLVLGPSNLETTSEILKDITKMLKAKKNTYKTYTYNNGILVLDNIADISVYNYKTKKPMKVLK